MGRARWAYAHGGRRRRAGPDTEHAADASPDRPAAATAPVDAARGALRRQGRAARAALSDRQRDEASRRILERLLALPELRAPGRVLLTAAIGDELDLSPVVAPLRARGATVALPRTRGERLELVDHPPDGRLTPGWRDVPEPTGPHDDAPLDVVLVPALVLDRAGGRLGYGGGHFDRLLGDARGPAADACRIGVVFSCQLVPEVPTLPHDVPLHVVVAETGVWRPHTAG